MPLRGVGFLACSAGFWFGWFLLFGLVRLAFWPFLDLLVVY
jgi:hypothetical protein